MSEDGERADAVTESTAHIAHSARSDVGRVRSVNEDSYLAYAPVYLVADGMGGHARGDAASQSTIETFRRHIPPGHPSTPEQVLDAIHSANQAVCDLSTEGDAGTAISGTTLSGIALVEIGAGELHWLVFNVGDSRVYSWDGRVLEQVTVDHSAVQELVTAGLIEASEAERHPDRNVITRALGAESFVEPDVWLVPALGRQTFVICSDGISKELDDDDVARILGGSTPSGELATELVDAALESGGHDNATVVVVEADFSALDADETATRGRENVLSGAIEDTRPRDGRGGGHGAVSA